MNEIISKYDYFPLGIIKAEINAVKLDLLNLYELNHSNEKWKISNEKLDLNKITLPPIIRKGGSHFPKFVIWTPKNLKGWTAFFSNYVDGLHTTKNILSKKYERTIINVNFSNKELIKEPAYIFQYYEGNKNERIVYSINDSGTWRFYEDGQPLEIENLTHYTNRIKNKRMNNEIILEYLTKMGISINQEFFKGNGNAIYFEKLKW